MKKFIASENMNIVTTTNFKNSIKFACQNTEKRVQYSTDFSGKKFLGTIVTFDNIEKEIKCFDLKSFVSQDDSQGILKSLNYNLNKIVENLEYSHLQFVIFIEASKFEYHSYIGFKCESQQEIEDIKLENIFMKEYIAIITNQTVNYEIDNSEKIQNMDFSIRTKNCLSRAGIDTVKQLKKLSQIEIFKIRNLGMNSYNEIEEKLNYKFI